MSTRDPHPCEVAVTIAWGDTVVHVVRWALPRSPRQKAAFVLPAAFGGAECLLRRTVDGSIHIELAAHSATLCAGMRLAITLGGDEGSGAYRTAGAPRPCVATFEHVSRDSQEVGRRATTSARRRATAMLAIATPLLFTLFAALGLASSVGPRLDYVDATGGAAPEATRPPRVPSEVHAARIMPIVLTAIDPSLLEPTRPLEPDDVPCGWACGRGDGASDAEIGFRPPVGSCLVEPLVHVVAPGETLTSIAHDFGLNSYQQLYDDRINAELVAARPDPNRIYAGDVVVIPNRQGWGTGAGAGAPTAAVGCVKEGSAS